MKRSLYFFGIFIISIVFAGLNSYGLQQVPKKSSKIVKKTALKSKGNIQQICGNIYKVSGNRMPDPDQTEQLGEPVSRVIFIYSLTNRSETEGDGINLYTKINTKRVKTVNSNNKGRFCVNLPLGKYSFFIEEPGFGTYANIFDDKMNICPIEVKKRKNADIVLKITHTATF